MTWYYYKIIDIVKTLETKEGKQFLPQTFGGVKKLQHFNEFSLLVLAPGIKG